MKEIRVPTFVLKLPHLTPADKLIYGMLNSLKKVEGWVSISLPDLADGLGLGHRTAYVGVKKLKGLGLIESRRVGLGDPNKYRLTQA